MIGAILFHLPLIVLVFYKQLRWEYVFINLLWVMAVQYLVESKMKRLTITVDEDGDVTVREE